mmetsp:Transcript_769/g.1590  ORF Transcript_769/g.1590 Transcript_769/m.1590 type:complete len:327 (+) Transcript_769:107-1087(+)
MGAPFQFAPFEPSVPKPCETSSQIFFFATLFTPCGSIFSASPHVIRSPGVDPSGATRSSTFSCAASDAASNIPFDFTPAILRGFKFATTTTSLPNTSSLLIYCAKPEQIKRGSPSPHSTVSIYNLSLSGWFSTLNTFPTFNSIPSKSSVNSALATDPPDAADAASALAPLPKSVPTLPPAAGTLMNGASQLLLSFNMASILSNSTGSSSRIQSSAIKFSLPGASYSSTSDKSNSRSCPNQLMIPCTFGVQSAISSSVMSIAAISASARKSGNGGNGGKSSGATRLIFTVVGFCSSSSFIGVDFASKAAGRQDVLDDDVVRARRHAL